MSFRALTADGDWTFGNGLQSYLRGEAAIAADIRTALKVFLGECFFALDFGVDWWNLIGGKDQAAIILQCRTVIAGRVGVTRINQVTARLDAQSRRLTLTYNIDTVYSRNATDSVLVP